MKRLFSGAGIGQTMTQRLNAPLLIAYSLDRVSAWLVTLAAVILAYQLTSSIGIAAAVILVQVLGRSFVNFAVGRDFGIHAGLVTFAAIVRVVAIAGLVLWTSQADVWWAVLLIGLVSLATGIVETGYAQLIPVIGRRKNVPSLNRSIGTCEQVAAIAGPLLTAAALWIVDERGAFVLAALFSCVSLMLFPRMFAEHGAPDTFQATNSGSRNPFTPGEWRLSDEVKAVITGLVAMAMLGIVVRLALLEVVIDEMGRAGSVYASLIAVVGIGALLGPVPVDRVLGHFPVAMVLAGGVIAVAIATAILSAGGPLFIVAPALLAAGIVIVTLDIASSVTLRRAVPEWSREAVNDTLMRLVLAGQVVALLVVLLLERAWDVRFAALALCGLCAIAVAVHFLRSGMPRSVRSIPRSDSDKSAPTGSAS